jgi:hypothetical protein
MESPAGGNSYLRNFQAEEKSPQDTPDAFEESAARALNGIGGLADWDASPMAGIPR